MRRIAIAFSLVAAVGCAHPPVEPLNVAPIPIGSGEGVVVDHSYVIIDSSASLGDNFEHQKALVQSFVGAMPDGNYQAGTLAFGGNQRDGLALGGFDRGKLVSAANGLNHLENGTPLYTVLDEVAGQLRGKKGKAAVVIFSDGQPSTPSGFRVTGGRVISAAESLAKSYDGELCIHTVQTGGSAEGGAILDAISSVTPCGSSRTAGDLGDIASLQGFERDVFIGAGGLPPVAASPVDSDGDGVYDGDDQCPGTPAAAKVDARGCWTIPGLNFAVDSSAIETQYETELNELVRVLNENPGLNVRIDGHTDSTGGTAYNQGLSERRAKAVRGYLENAGIETGRLSTKGFGEGNPAYPNDTADNRRGNRRTELTAGQ